MITWMYVIITLCFSLHFCYNKQNIEYHDQDLKQTGSDTWTSLLLLDPDRNSVYTRTMINNIFTKSGYPREMQNQSVNWGYWTEDIIFQYPEFTFPEPHFASDQDKNLFHSLAKNLNFFRDSNLGAESQFGVVRIMYGAKAHRGYSM